MKRLFVNFMLVAVAAMAFTACQNETDGVNVTPEQNTITMTFVADAPESRTSVAIDDKTAIYSWSEGDKVGFYYVDIDATGKKKKNSNAAVISGSTATFALNLGENDFIEGATAYNIGAFYPGNSHAGHAEADFFNNVNVKIPAMQILTEGSFDPAADLMMSKPFMDVELNNGDVKTLEFTRIAAIGKMNLKLEGMEFGEVIKSVKFSFAEGTHFNGPVTLDLENSVYTLGTEGTSNAVTLSGSLEADSDSDRTAIFFTCFPGEYSGAYTIEVETDKASYSKEGTLNNALTFTAGNVLNLNATAENRAPKQIDESLPTVTLTNDDIIAINAKQAYADSARTINAADGSVWKFKGYRQNVDNNYLQLKAMTDSTTPYIQLPNVNGEIQKVVLEVGSASATAAGGNTRTYHFNDSVGGTSVVSGTGAAEITLDVEGKGKSTGYIQVAGGATRVFGITVYYVTGESGGETTEPATQTISFPNDTYTATVGGSFTAPTLSGAQTTVTYSSSNKAVATVDETTGAVTLVAAGTTTITASAAATDAYKAATASYTLTVNAKQDGGETGDDVSGITYTKITSTSELTDGVYIIVYESGTSGFVFNGQDEANGYESATISSNTITADEAFAGEVTIAAMSGGYSLKVANGYMYGKSGDNKLLFADTAQVNTITISNSVATITSNTSVIKFNNASNQMRFRYYKSGQQTVTLYKKN